MHVLILGTRGVPAQHGGFETFAQDLAIFLTASNHKVTVYCQTDKEDGLRKENGLTEDVWNGIRRVIIPAGKKNAWQTIKFDWASVRHACKEDGVFLTLGYNTGLFNYLLRWHNRPTVMNMDGLEWKRTKWPLPHRIWLRFNEWAGASSSAQLIADHPEISSHLQRHTAASKITCIPYGADVVSSAPSGPVEALGLSPRNYYLVIARPEPDNSIMEIVRAYSLRKRETPLVVLGKYTPDTNKYHREVIQAAGPGVKFLGAIYDREIVEPLRFHSKAYIHGHRFGGTNPSLVESLAAGNAIIAHDNCFTRWVAEGARFFGGVEDLAAILDSIESDPAQLSAMKATSRLHHREKFLQDRVLFAYERLLLRIDEQSSNKKLGLSSAGKPADIDEGVAYRWTLDNTQQRRL